MALFFDNSSPKRRKRALSKADRVAALVSSPIPPANEYEFLSHAELTEKSLTLALDVESSPNYFLVSLMDVETRKVVYFEHGFGAELDCQKLAFLLYRHKIVTFNGIKYDVPVIGAALAGLSTEKLKEISNELIQFGMQPWEIERKYGIKSPQVNHIDLIEVAPLDAGEAGLKLYCGRIHSERLQELPYPHDMELSWEQACNLRDYNINDLHLTCDLYHFLKPQLELRESLSQQYRADLRSKSDAQISEAVIVGELRKLGVNAKKPKVEPGRLFKYEPPAYLRFRTPQFQRAFDNICNAVFEVEENGTVHCPPEIEKFLPELGSCRYAIGIGGLHTKEKSVGYSADENFVLIDRDVASYYPRIILNQRLYPDHLGPEFLQVYETIVNRRLEAKNAKNKVVAESLKIVINGGFGKLGSPWSFFYSPRLLLQVTLTGQLSLMMQAEMIELAGGFEVLSANTDGLVIKCPRGRTAELEAVIKEWEAATGFQTEEARYLSLWSRDVNNYIAIKEEFDEKLKVWTGKFGGFKVKGVFSEKGSALNSELSKNPESLICSEAVQAFLAHGVPMRDTIQNCKDFKRFVNLKRVQGGAHKDGVYLGKVVRWYYPIDEEGEINAVRSDNKVGKTEGARPVMNMPVHFPNDVDYCRYERIANDMLFDLGYHKRPKVGSLF